MPAAYSFEMLKNQLLSRREIDKNDCWNWTGTFRGKKPFHYGVMGYGGKHYSVPRIALFIFSGFDLKSPLCVLHSCDNPKCFNPNHLFLGDAAINNNDAAKKQRTAWGAKNAAALLKESGVLFIRQKARIGKRHNTDNSIAGMAIRFGVSYHTIYAIVRGALWRHLSLRIK